MSILVSDLTASFWLFSGKETILIELFILLKSMTKQELLIQTLEKLVPYRELADGILALVQSEYADDETIDAVIHLISQSIRTTKKEQEKIILQKWLEKIQTIKHMEDDEKMSEGDLDKLLADI